MGRRPLWMELWAKPGKNLESQGLQGLSVLTVTTPEAMTKAVGFAKGPVCTALRTQNHIVQWSVTQPLEPASPTSKSRLGHVVAV